MKIATLAVVVGNQACNVACPCCVSKMTPLVGISEQPKKVNWRNLEIACQLAASSGVTTAMITGKGEPCLFPDIISETVNKLSDYFPLIELQTNGVIFNKIFQGGEDAPKWRQYLSRWYDLGMTLICLSVMHPQGDRNWQVMRAREKYDFWEIADLLHTHGFSVRINVTLTKQFVSDREGGLPETFDIAAREPMERTQDAFEWMATRCRNQGIEQLTLRNVNMPDGCDNEVAQWVKDNQYDATAFIQSYLRRKNAVPLLELGHGATVYDYQGQNVSINNCLTESRDPEEIRQLIFFPDGHLRYSWSHPGAIIL